MDPVKNPYQPGAGTRPPELAGRDSVRESVRIAMERLVQGRHAKSSILVGLRGVGKTVLLHQMQTDAEGAGLRCVAIEAPEGRSLPGLLAPSLRAVLIRISTIERAKQSGNRALRALAGFVGGLKAKYQDIELRLDFTAEPGLADAGDLERDLQDLLLMCGEAARAADTAIVMFIDELQYVEEDELGALIVGLHAVSQRGLPVSLVAAGLPQLRAQLGNAKSYAERMFEFPEIGPLEPEDAKSAIVKPAREEGVAFEVAAIEAILSRTQRYPYFLQEWGKNAWDVADASPISRSDVDVASEIAVASLDASFFRVRFDRLTPAEKRYVRAMAELGPGPHRSGDVASELDRRVQSLGPTRSSLIRKGMVYSPSHGDTAFTVPLFDEFMKRIMPDDDWRSA
ncbi:MAG: AAA family ATPase [Phycisphaerae bacterium]|nr:AAA family ATPase [Phycisphaerae bacterium]